MVVDKSQTSTPVQGREVTPIFQGQLEFWMGGGSTVLRYLLDEENFRRRHERVDFRIDRHREDLKVNMIPLYEGQPRLELRQDKQNRMFDETAASREIVTRRIRGFFRCIVPLIGCGFLLCRLAYVASPR